MSGLATLLSSSGGESSWSSAVASCESEVAIAVGPVGGKYDDGGWSTSKAEESVKGFRVGAA